MDVTSTESYTENVICPFLMLLENPFEQFKRLMMDISSKDLGLVMEMIKSGALMHLKEFTSLAGLKEFVVECAYAYEFADTCDALDYIAEFLDQKDAEDTWDTELEGLELQDNSKLEMKRGMLKAHIAAKEILSYYSIEQSLKWIKEEMVKEEDKIFRELSQYPLRHPSDDPDLLWETVLEHLLSIQRLGLFTSISRRKIAGDLSAAILREGSKHLAVI
jgi:hypothetical protein